jgi:hypothetical protein
LRARAFSPDAPNFFSSSPPLSEKKNTSGPRFVFLPNAMPSPAPKRAPAALLLACVTMVMVAQASAAGE